MDKTNSPHIGQEPLGLIDQVVNDLTDNLKSYRNIKIGVRLISDKSGVSERTIYRLLAKENKPTYQTLLKLYRAIYNTNNDTLLLSLVPEVIKNEINKCNPNRASEGIQFHENIETQMLYDRTFAEIYILAACSPITNELIQYRYGMSGMLTLEKMLDMKALRQTKAGLYTLGENQTNFSAKTLKRLGMSLIEKYSKPQNAEDYGNNIIGFYAEGLSDEAYNRWLEVDAKAFEEKVKIANESKSKGTKRSFTFMVTDTLNEK
ncbi:helix-turn-helix domain-containing protein [Halobacteriovorax sp. YZS-1-1]|uniref:helix-turn-helix domain-containing protein n=1 Tax=unclassified Halobacteriovorax TaxID=2639665 RepID=UPI003999C6FC